MPNRQDNLPGVSTLVARSKLNVWRMMPVTPRRLDFLVEGDQKCIGFEPHKNHNKDMSNECRFHVHTWLNMWWCVVYVQNHANPKSLEFPRFMFPKILESCTSMIGLDESYCAWGSNHTCHNSMLASWPGGGELVVWWLWHLWHYQLLKNHCWKKWSSYQIVLDVQMHDVSMSR